MAKNQTEKEMNLLIEQFPEHYRLHCEILDSVNNSIKLINELVKLEETGVENIDNTTALLFDGFYNISKIFIVDEEEDYEFEDEGGLG